MDAKKAIKRQHHLGLAMLRQCIERCPEDFWTSGKHPRTYWRIVYHALYYTYKYLQRNEREFVEWRHHRPKTEHLWGRPGQAEPYSQAQLLEFLAFVDENVDSLIDDLDLDHRTSGFNMYGMPKLALLLLNLRHLQGHVGQLSDRLMEQGIDVDWLGMRR